MLNKKQLCAFWVSLILTLFLMWWAGVNFFERGLGGPFAVFVSLILASWIAAYPGFRSEE